MCGSPLKSAFSLCTAELTKIPAIFIFDTCEFRHAHRVQQAASLRGGFEELAAVGGLTQATGRTTKSANTASDIPVYPRWSAKPLWWTLPAWWVVALGGALCFKDSCHIGDSL